MISNSFEEINLYLFSLLPEKQINDVFNKNDICDIDSSFLGFVDTYYYLSKLIPKHFTVIDFGCAYNPQCYFFLEHYHYIAVDPFRLFRFKSNNCDIYEGRIKDFIISNIFTNLNIEQTFAICNYVPSNEVKMVREQFKNLFTFYPNGGKDIIIPRNKKEYGKK